MSGRVCWYERLTLWVYQLVMAMLPPLLRRKLARRAVTEPGYGEAVAERFGIYAERATAQGRGEWVWLHAVSLGETRAAAVLVQALRAQMPSMRLLLTHSTATGRSEGLRLLRPGDAQAWLPWDTPDAVDAFLTHFQPRVGVLMETEVWPTLVQACRARGVALVLANARLNERSLAKARRMAWLSRPAYAGLAAVWAQTNDDAERLALLGAPVSGVWGNLKFDAQPDAAQAARAQAWRASHRGEVVVMLASSREGEEFEFFKQIEQLSLDGKHLFAAEKNEACVRWLVVPRHPQRFDQVAALVEAHGWVCRRRSQWANGVPPSPDGASRADTASNLVEIWLGDSVGDMSLYYHLSSVALLGGSFEPLGGQNLIEAAACGCPLVLGPHTFNFAQAADQAVEAGAARRAAGMAEGVELAMDWLAQPPERQEASLAAVRFASAHTGAAQKTAAAVLALVSAPATR